MKNIFLTTILSFFLIKCNSNNLKNKNMRFRFKFHLNYNKFFRRSYFNNFTTGKISKIPILLPKENNLYKRINKYKINIKLLTLPLLSAVCFANMDASKNKSYNKTKVHYIDIKENVSENYFLKKEKIKPKKLFINESQITFLKEANYIKVQKDKKEILGYIPYIEEKNILEQNFYYKTKKEADLFFEKELGFINDQMILAKNDQYSVTNDGSLSLNIYNSKTNKLISKISWILLDIPKYDDWWGYYSCARFTDNGRFLVVGDQLGFITIWNIEDIKKIKFVRYLTLKDDDIDNIVIKKNQILSYNKNNMEITIWKVQDIL